MKLWLLERGFDGTYDANCGFVIRAETEQEARALGEKQSGDEPDGCWLDPKESKCSELLPDGEPGIVLTDFVAG